MAHTPTPRSALAVDTPTFERPPAGARFEAPLAQSPYPVTMPSVDCLDTRDLDLDDGLEPFTHQA